MCVCLSLNTCVTCIPSSSNRSLAPTVTRDSLSPSSPSISRLAFRSFCAAVVLHPEFLLLVFFFVVTARERRLLLCFSPSSFFSSLHTLARPIFLSLFYCCIYPFTLLLVTRHLEHHLSNTRILFLSPTPSPIFSDPRRRPATKRRSSRRASPGRAVKSLTPAK